MKRILALRQRWPGLGQGSLKFLQPDNRKILAFLREHDGQRVLVVANLSRYAQAVELDLSAFQGCVPVEIFGRTRFPGITKDGYRLTVSPHAFFWFAVESAKPAEAGSNSLPARIAELPQLVTTGAWTSILEDESRGQLTEALVQFVQQRRWFGGKARQLRGIDLLEAIEIPTAAGLAYMALLNADYAAGDAEVYVLPLGYVEGAEAEAILRGNQASAIARVLSANGGEGLLFDVMASKPFARALLSAMAANTTFRGTNGNLVARATEALSIVREVDLLALEPSLSRAEHSNTAVIFGDQFLFKLFRRPETGINPDVEINDYLTARQFRNVPALGGAIEYWSAGVTRSLGILTRFVAGATDGWDYTLDALGRYFDRVLLYVAENRAGIPPEETLLTLSDQEPPDAAVKTIGTYLESARMLGVRTAELHLALGAGEEPAFAPEPFSSHYQRSLYQSMRNLVVENFELLMRRVSQLPSALQADAKAVLALEDSVLVRYKELYIGRLDAMRIRVHGDFHLGQVLSTGTDFVIVDFEGEPARALSARRLKRSPISDVAGMIRSFHYAVHTALQTQVERGLLTPENRGGVAQWATYWRRWISANYLRAYLKTMGNSRILPTQRRELEILLDAYLIDKAVYEIGYELNNRPDWLAIPFSGILQMMSSTAK